MLHCKAAGPGAPTLILIGQRYDWPMRVSARPSAGSCTLAWHFARCALPLLSLQSMPKSLISDQQEDCTVPQTQITAQLTKGAAALPGGDRPTATAAVDQAHPEALRNLCIRKVQLTTTRITHSISDCPAAPSCGQLPRALALPGLGVQSARASRSLRTAIVHRMKKKEGLQALWARPSHHRRELRECTASRRLNRVGLRLQCHIRTHRRRGHSKRHCCTHRDASRSGVIGGGTQRGVAAGASTRRRGSGHGGPQGAALPGQGPAGGGCRAPGRLPAGGFPPSPLPLRVFRHPQPAAGVLDPHWLPDGDWLGAERLPAIRRCCTLRRRQRPAACADGSWARWRACSSPSTGCFVRGADQTGYHSSSCDPQCVQSALCRLARRCCKYCSSRWQT